MLDFWMRVKRLMVVDLTQAWLADEAGVSLSTLTGWINKNRIPPADKAQKIADALGVTVEYLVTGKEPYSDEVESRLPKALDRPITYLTPNQREYTLSTGQHVVNIPIYTSTVSAGLGIDVFDAGEVQFLIPVLKDVVCQYDINALAGVSVTGDSMIDENISHGDYVIFARGYIKGNGIYVIMIGDEAYVKQVEFDPIDHEITLYSANEMYPPKVISAEREDIRVVGKVVAWTHLHLK